MTIHKAGYQPTVISIADEVSLPDTDNHIAFFDHH